MVIPFGSGVCCLVGEVGLEDCAGFLVGRTVACPLEGGAGIFPSGGQGHVKGGVYRQILAQDDFRQPVC